MASKAAIPAWRIALRRWAYKKSAFCELGLMIDDCLHETPAIKCAIGRLPKDMLAERTFRISRAFLHSTNKTVLPKEEWMTIDKDVRYLKPYLDQVEKEFAEKIAWNKR